MNRFSSLGVAFTILLFSSCSPTVWKIEGVTSQSDKFWLWTIDFSPRVDKFVTGGTNGTVVIESKSGIEDSLRVDGQVTEVQWNPVSDMFAASVQGGQKSFIRDIQNGVSYALDDIDDFGARALGWSPDGTKLAVGDYSGVLSIHDLRGRLLSAVKINDKGVIGLDWSPDGSKIVTVGQDIVIVDLIEQTTTSIQDREEDVLMLCVAYHPSGKIFVTGDYGDADKGNAPLLQYWTADGQLIRRINESKGEYRSIEWSHDGKELATASDRVRIFNANGVLLRQGEEQPTLLWGISWSHDDKVIAATDSEGAIIMYDRRLKTVSRHAGK